ncbi:MAG: hypothetical protein ACREJQ_02210 [bacterium]
MNYLKDPRIVTLLVLLAIAAVVYDYYVLIGGAKRPAGAGTGKTIVAPPRTPPATPPAPVAPPPGMPSIPSVGEPPSPATPGATAGKVPFYDLNLTEHDPFQEGSEPSYFTSSELDRLPPPPITGAAAMAPPPPPAITVTLISIFRGDRKAILVMENNSFIVQVGDKIGDETVTAIEEDGVFLKGATSSRWIRLSGMSFGGSQQAKSTSSPMGR